MLAAVIGLGIVIFLTGMVLGALTNARRQHNQHGTEETSPPAIDLPGVSDGERLYLYRIYVARIAVL